MPLLPNVVMFDMECGCIAALPLCSGGEKFIRNVEED